MGTSKIVSLATPRNLPGRDFEAAGKTIDGWPLLVQTRSVSQGNSGQPPSFTLRVRDRLMNKPGYTLSLVVGEGRVNRPLRTRLKVAGAEGIMAAESRRGGQGPRFKAQCSMANGQGSMSKVQGLIFTAPCRRPSLAQPWPLAIEHWPLNIGPWTLDLGLRALPLRARFKRPNLTLESARGIP